MKFGLFGVIVFFIILSCFVANRTTFADSEDFKLSGTVDVPDSTLPLPVGTDDVQITLFIGGPGGTPVIVVLTELTTLKAEEVDQPPELRDGDRVKAKGNIVGGGLVVTEFEIEDFEEVKLAGLVNMDGVLTLPVDFNTPINLAVGGATGPVLTIILTPDTRVEIEELEGPSILHDDDFVEIEVVLRGPDLIAREIEIEDFGELEITGTVTGLSGPLTLPITGDTSATFQIVIGSLDTTITLEIVITSATVIEGGLTSLINGNQVEVEAVIRGGMIRATELERED